MITPLTEAACDSGGVCTGLFNGLLEGVVCGLCAVLIGGVANLISLNLVVLLDLLSC